MAEYEYLVVGGGIAGLSTALHLALRTGKPGRICVLEKGYIGYGASTRNATHFRVHFFSKENTQFAIESRKRLLSLPKLTGYNPLVVKGGYLWLFPDEETSNAYMKYNENLWKPLGVPIIFMDKGELERRYPFLNLSKIHSAAIGPQDGSFHHDSVVYGYYSKSRKLGVKICEHTAAVKINIRNNHVDGVTLDNGGSIDSENVIVAAGAWSRRLLETAGVSIPTNPVLKEILVTEPYRYKFKELFIYKEFYFTQTLKGEILGSTGLDKEPEGLVEMGNSIRWLTAFARAMTSILKGSGNIRILRTWSGYYNMTPDRAHILGRSDDWPEGLYVNTGYSGHGFMMAPYAGEVLADYIITGKVHRLMEPFLPTRFKTGKLIKEGLVIG
ncbi:MAG: FAD-binding oxidoreductase [Desulfurococcales archaeon]|nr:FAD-binding oxidoreductase [Desulfurococcales archaeon]